MHPTMNLKRISIVAGGSRGDIQPYIAIGAELRNAGYDVRILSNVDHASFVDSFDLHHRCKFANLEEHLKNNSVMQKAMNEGNAGNFFKGVAELNKENSVRDSCTFLDEMRHNRPDLLIAGSLYTYFPHYALRVLNIPTISVKLQAIVHDPKRALWGLPTLPDGQHYESFCNMIRSFYDGWKYFDEAMISLGEKPLLPSYTKSMFVKDMQSPPVPYIICQSPLFKDILYPQAHPNIQFVGASIIDSKQQQAHHENFGGDGTRKDIEKFLGSNQEQKPVYLGWGSMTCKSPEHMVNFAVRALQLSDQRGIVLGGWADLSMATLQRATTDQDLIGYAKENVLFVKRAPHEYLFPRVSCTVHHGGAGTTNSALRCGVPTIVTPVWGDQFDHAHLVTELGVGIGFSKQLHQTTAEDLGAAIKAIISNEPVAMRANELASMLRKENGAAAVVSKVEHFWEDYVNNGVVLSRRVDMTDSNHCLGVQGVNH